MHSIRIVPWHHEDVHLFEKARSPSSIGVHFAQKCHRTLVGGWLIAMNSSLKPHAKFVGVETLAIRIAQESSEDRPSLLRFEVGNLVVEPVMSTRNAS
jgi:hypothetical protein